MIVNGEQVWGPTHMDSLGDSKEYTLIDVQTSDSESLPDSFYGNKEYWAAWLPCHRCGSRDLVEYKKYEWDHASVYRQYIMRCCNGSGCHITR